MVELYNSVENIELFVNSTLHPNMQCYLCLYLKQVLYYKNVFRHNDWSTYGM
jgi:hypothetical protein